MPASRKLGRADAARLLAAAATLVVAKGKKVDEYPGGTKAPEAAVDAMLGPTGNLRAPALRVGRTLVVGFDEATYRRLLG